MKISDILRQKDNATVVTIAPDRPVTELLAALAEHKIGAVVVTDGDQVRGIASERDVVRRLNDRGHAVLDGAVADLMTALVVTCRPDDDVDEVAALMTERRVRHVPVLKDGQLAGLVSIGDVVLSRIRQLEHDRGQLEQYITG
jgi:CBS domain-containing protein